MNLLLANTTLMLIFKQKKTHTQNNELNRNF